MNPLLELIEEQKIIMEHLHLIITITGMIHQVQEYQLMQMVIKNLKLGHGNFFFSKFKGTHCKQNNNFRFRYI